MATTYLESDSESILQDCEDGVYVEYSRLVNYYSRTDTVLKVFTIGRSGSVQGLMWQGCSEYNTFGDVCEIASQMVDAIRKNTVFDGDGLQKNLSSEQVETILSSPTTDICFKEFAPTLVDNKGLA